MYLLSDLYIILSLTALVQLVDTGDVILAHLSGSSEVQVRIALSDDGWLAIFGEGVS